MTGVDRQLRAALLPLRATLYPTLCGRDIEPFCHSVWAATTGYTRAERSCKCLALYMGALAAIVTPLVAIISLTEAEPEAAPR